jgi:hypothetical protein
MNMARKSGLSSATVPAPSPMPGATTGDARSDFASITKKTPRDKALEEAFVANKMLVLQTQPTLSRNDRVSLLGMMPNWLTTGKTQKQPVPGGVGYGMFYNSGFKTHFETGTGIYWEIICPNTPGGNVSTWLYVTAMNRSAMGVEAFVAYGTSEPCFMVFDWARSDHWQTRVPFSSLARYFKSASAHGMPYQVLPVMNMTSQNADGSWDNQVSLWDNAANRWDLIYQYNYAATQSDQYSGWVGTWGPIVETFQNLYQGTAALGALNTKLLSRDGNNQWGSWHLLDQADSDLRTDNVGLQMLFLDPNSSWAVNS